MNTKTFVCASAALICLLAIQSVRAEIVFQGWQEFAFPITDDLNCAGEDGVASGMVHTTITEMASGYGVRLNAIGIVKGDDSGTEYLWRDNIVEVVPFDDWGTHAVGTTQERLKIIGKGGQYVKFVLLYKAHLTEIGGEVVVYFDGATFLCQDP